MPKGVPYTEKELIKLGKELIACVEEDNVWHVCVFAHRKEKADSWINELARDHKIFNKYFQRARKILGHKILNQAMTAKPDNWMVKLLFKRLMNTEYEPIEKWVKDDLLDEAKAKADATKAIFNDLHPAIKQILDDLDNKKK